MSITSVNRPFCNIGRNLIHASYTREKTTQQVEICTYKLKRRKMNEEVHNCGCTKCK